MSSRCSIGKGKFADCEPQVKDILIKCDAIGQKLLQLMEDDINGYNSVLLARKLPKSTKEDAAQRSKSIQTASITAMQPPLETTRSCLEMLRLIRGLVESANSNLISDIGVAALLTNAALIGGKLNVDINIKSLSDKCSVKTISAEVNAAAKEASKLVDEIMEIVNTIIAE